MFITKEEPAKGASHRPTRKWYLDRPGNVVFIFLHIYIDDMLEIELAL